MNRPIEPAMPRPPLRGWTTAAILFGIGALLDFLITAATATPV